MTLGEPGRVASIVTNQLERQGVSYAVVGSVASSVHGIPRSTQDVDLVAALKPGDVERFAGAVEQGFYVDRGMIREAVRHKSSFNVIHLDTMLKVDVFVVSSGGRTGDELEHATRYVIDEEGAIHFQVASAEDTIARKLERYRRGEEVSDQQLKDVMGILEVQGESLDLEYLQRVARSLGVGDLLRQVCDRAGLEIGNDR